MQNVNKVLLFNYLFIIIIIINYYYQLRNRTYRIQRLAFL